MKPFFDDYYSRRMRGAYRSVLPPGRWSCRRYRQLYERLYGKGVGTFRDVRTTLGGIDTVIGDIV